MKRKKNIKAQSTPETHFDILSRGSQTRRSVFIILLFVFALLTVLAIYGEAGEVGQIIFQSLSFLFGWGKFMVPFLLFFTAFSFLRKDGYSFRIWNFLGMLFFAGSLFGFLHLFVPSVPENTIVFGNNLGGGWFGFVISRFFLEAMGFWASFIVLLSTMIVSILLIFETALPDIFLGIKKIFFPFRKMQQWLKFVESNDENEKEIEEEDEEKEEESLHEEKKRVPQFNTHAIRQELKETLSKPNAQKMFPIKGEFRETYSSIPLELLSTSSTKPLSGNIRQIQELIQKTLSNFGVEVEMGEANVGPAVTQYTLRPLEAIKLTKITTLHNELALALAAHPIRIEAPIPGKSLVGIEVPNKTVAIVTLREALGSEDFRSHKGNLPISLGKDVSGRVWAANLETMPHCLIAGATGSGKTVCINTIIMSLLFQHSPAELKLILVDPKRVELPQYNGIPHLLTPVIVEVEQTINTLRWAIYEMERRFNLLSTLGKRNIQTYNKVAQEALPYIVIIIDELADLMSTAARDVEAAIIRLAQMARAVGIHLVVATQRPSVDIITGLIKANIPTRISFSVASLVDSRTILDTAGAEKLLGKGDLLFLSAELSKPKRLQGAYVSDEEITRVVNYLREQGQPEYNEEIFKKRNTSIRGNFNFNDDDPLLLDARAVVMEAGKASASLLQRRLRVGYARAARLLDLLEAQGIVGPSDGAKPREVFMNDFSKNREYNDDFRENIAGLDAERDEVDEEKNKEFISL